jgi:hypothetical protein
MKRNPKKLEDLRKYLFEEWGRLDQKIIQKMYSKETPGISF